MGQRQATHSGTSGGAVRSTETSGAASAAAAVNEVHLVGRAAAAGESRTLPSGDVVSVLRVVVQRPPGTRRTARTPTIDTVECAIWPARLRQRAEALMPGTLVEVTGSLRRRFWRTPGGPASRYEVEVQTLRRLTAAEAESISPPSPARRRGT
jgi:single-strand DNA-binding protein